MWFAWRWMAISEKGFPDVVLHGDLEGTVFLVPFMINNFLCLPLPVVSDRVVILQCGEDMLCVMLAEIFDSKIMDC